MSGTASLGCTWKSGVKTCCVCYAYDEHAVQLITTEIIDDIT